MKACFFRHQSDSRYCFVIDASGRVLLRLGIDKDIRPDSVSVIYGPPQSFDNNHQSKPMTPHYNDGDFIYYETVLEEQPSRYYYLFEVLLDSRRYIVTETGVVEHYDYHLGFLSAFQMIAENRADYVLPKPSWEGRVIYQIFPERFAIGMDEKSKGYVNKSWDSIGFDLLGNFLGGDLPGITSKLDYLLDLGISAIYLTPIHPAPSNHKYDVLDYFDVDEQFGGKEAFAKLVEEAHKRDIKIILDMVFNHTSFFHPFFQDCLKRGKKSPYHEYYFIHDDKPDYEAKNYETFSNIPYMPKLDTSNPKVQDFIIKVATFWAKEFHVDGYRLDVCEGVSHECWTRVKMALKKIDPEFLLLGESWLNSESYLGPNQIDGVMNYPLLGVISKVVLRLTDVTRIVHELSSLLIRYKQGHNAMMLNLLSSHDIERFIRLCKGDKNRVLTGYALLFAFPGMPCIYYGDEVFLDGGSDPDSRRGFPWNSEEFLSEEHSCFQELIHFHNDHSCFKSGETDISSEGDLLVVTRRNEKERISLYINLSDYSIPFSKKSLLSHDYDHEEIMPLGFVFCY